MAHLALPLYHLPWATTTSRRKNLQISARSKSLKHDAYQILKFPLKTESTMKRIQQDNTLVFISDISADKTSIKDALKAININTSKVNTLTRPHRSKKVYVKLSPEYDAFTLATKIGFIGKLTTKLEEEEDLLVFKVNLRGGNLIMFQLQFAKSSP